MQVLWQQAVGSRLVARVRLADLLVFLSAGERGRVHGGQVLEVDVGGLLGGLLFGGRLCAPALSGRPLSPVPVPASGPEVGPGVSQPERLRGPAALPYSLQPLQVDPDICVGEAHGSARRLAGPHVRAVVPPVVVVEADVRHHVDPCKVL